MSRAFVAFGTNLDNREQNITDAIEALRLVPKTVVINVSKIYETEPWGYAEQDNFLNGVIELETSLNPFALLGALLGIEAAMGRHRTIKNGPRIIDLDLLIYDNEKINSKELMLPHPRMMERAFVLKPLTDILPEEPYLTALSQQDITKVWEYEA